MPNYSGVWTLASQFQAAGLNLWPVIAPSNPDRALFAGGFGPSNALSYNNVEYVTVSTTGNAVDFGDLLTSTNSNSVGLCGSTIRGLIAGGGNNTIQYMTFATTGNAVDFGDLPAASSVYRIGAASNSTRGVFGGGSVNPDNYSAAIWYVTIATTGNATSFGSLTLGRDAIAGGGSPTRALFMGGHNGGNYTNIIDYVTIATTGSAIDFGDLNITNLKSGAIAGSDTRSIYFGGHDTNGVRQGSRYVTIATSGNSVDFGSLSPVVQDNTSFSNNIRAGSASGQTPGQSSIQYVTIATTGNAVTFGYLSITVMSNSGMSSNHGGLQ